MAKKKDNTFAPPPGDAVKNQLERLPALQGDERKLMTLVSDLYQDFLASGKNLRDLALEYHVPVDIVLSWAKEGRWVERRDIFRNELMVDLEIDYAKFIKDNRTKAAQSILDAIGPRLTSLADGLDAAIRENKSTDVRRYAEAAKAMADIVTKITGLDTPLQPMTVKTEVVEDKGGGKPAWVINATGPISIDPAGVPADEGANVIDITEEEIVDGEGKEEETRPAEKEAGDGGAEGGRAGPEPEPGTESNGGKP